MIYYVSPTCDQLDWDEDGPVDRNLFVWATDASEAIKLWRAYYEENRPAAIRKSGERAGSYLVAEVFGARSIILLKDVDGLYTADPKTQAETMSLKQSHNPKVRPFGLHAGGRPAHQANKQPDLRLLRQEFEQNPVEFPRALQHRK
jgi:Amino acid kinase family